jgi:uncharacterized protein (TIGR01619 family)
MSDNWDFYPLLVDSEPASIYLDLGVAQSAPIKDLADMAYVRVIMRQPRPDGLSSQGEFDDLIAVEDSLSERFANDHDTIYVGRNTSSGNRDFYFYTSNPAAFHALASETMSNHPNYRYEVGGRPDPDWEVYFGFLHPSPDDLQRISNRRVIESLESHGDNLSEPRLIDHRAYLPNAAAAAELRAYVSGQGFSVDEPTIDGGQVVLDFKRSDQPGKIDDVVVPVARRVQELGGEYDGWGCEVVE